MDVVIYHNPACGTSRNAFALIRNAGVEPHLIEYLKCPPSGTMVRQLADRTGLGIRGLLREKDTPFSSLGLSDVTLTDEQLLEAIASHPILLNRPIVVSPGGFGCAGRQRPSSTCCRLSAVPWPRRTVNLSSTPPVPESAEEEVSWHSRDGRPSSHFLTDI